MIAHITLWLAAQACLPLAILSVVILAGMFATYFGLGRRAR